MHILLRTAVGPNVIESNQTNQTEPRLANLCCPDDLIGYARPAMPSFFSLIKLSIPQALDDQDGNMRQKRKRKRNRNGKGKKYGDKDKDKKML